jgi:hypothetical protein
MKESLRFTALVVTSSKGPWFKICYSFFQCWGTNPRSWAWLGMGCNTLTLCHWVASLTLRFFRVCVCVCVCVCGSTGFEFQKSCLLGKISAPALFRFSYFFNTPTYGPHVAGITVVLYHMWFIGWVRVLLTFCVGWHQMEPPDFHFLSSQDYKH